MLVLPEGASRGCDDDRMRKRKYSSLPNTADAAILHDGTPLPVVHNIVATSQISSSLPTLDLTRIHEMLPFSFYDQSKFAAITVRLHAPDCTTLLFSSGKLVVTGCRTWYQCVYASLFIANLLQECVPGHIFQLVACDVQNMVAHVEIPLNGGFLDLHGMYAQMALNCTYQRKMFPGLIFRPESSPVVLLCFFSGKIVITGGKTMEDVYSGWNRLWPVLRAFVTDQPCDGGRQTNPKRPQTKQRQAELTSNPSPAATSTPAS
jgi:transcription initiation factor TFIID TATA-box-binding protein